LPAPIHWWFFVVQNDVLPVHFLENRLVAATSKLWKVFDRPGSLERALPADADQDQRREARTHLH